MKIFISADIEGVAGSNFREECRMENPEYEQFADQMTKEVIAAAQGAFDAGASELVVKDGHGLANNIDIFQLPAGVKLIRGKSGHPYNMIYGLDETFDAAIFIGYHAGVGSPGSPLAHTSTGSTLSISLNGVPASEFLINSYTAELSGVPVVFISGDETICEEAKNINPAIKTLATKKGLGASTINLAPIEVIEKIRSGVRESLKGDLQKMRIDLPDEFEEIISFKDHTQAFRMQFYPGMEMVDDHTIKLVSVDYMDILTANSFVL